MYWLLKKLSDIDAKTAYKRAKRSYVQTSKTLLFATKSDQSSLTRAELIYWNNQVYK